MRKKMGFIFGSILVLAVSVTVLVSAVMAGKSASDEAVYYMSEVTEEGMLSFSLYDENEKQLLSKETQMKLPAFEGLYETDGVYYGVFSASDTEAEETRFMVVKYDADFEELGVCEVTDEVTYDASSATGVSLVKAGDMLWLTTVSGVRAAEEVFAADMTYMISEESMTVLDSLYHLYDAELCDRLTARVYEDEGAVLAVMNDTDEDVILYRMQAENGRISVLSTECVFFASDELDGIRKKFENDGLRRITSLSEKLEDGVESSDAEEEGIIDEVSDDVENENTNADVKTEADMGTDADVKVNTEANVETFAGVNADTEADAEAGFDSNVSSETEAKSGTDVNANAEPDEEANTSLIADTEAEADVNMDMNEPEE